MSERDYRLCVSALPVHFLDICALTIVLTSCDLERRIHVPRDCSCMVSKGENKTLKGHIATIESDIQRPEVTELLTKTEHFPSQTNDITMASDT